MSSNLASVKCLVAVVNKLEKEKETSQKDTSKVQESQETPHTWTLWERLLLACAVKSRINRDFRKRATPQSPANIESVDLGSVLDWEAVASVLKTRLAQGSKDSSWVTPEICVKTFYATVSKLQGQLGTGTEEQAELLIVRYAQCLKIHSKLFRKVLRLEQKLRMLKAEDQMVKHAVAVISTGRCSDCELAKDEVPPSLEQPEVSMEMETDAVSQPSSSTEACKSDSGSGLHQSDPEHRSPISSEPLQVDEDRSAILLRYWKKIVAILNPWIDSKLLRYPHLKKWIKKPVTLNKIKYGILTGSMKTIKDLKNGVYLMFINELMVYEKIDSLYNDELLYLLQICLDILQQPEPTEQ